MTGALFLVLTMMLSLAVATTVHAEPDAITAKPLTQRHAFGGNVSVQITQELDGLPAQVVDIEDASKVAVVEFTIQPGAVFPWHTHPGTVLINITEGDFVFVFGEDCVERRYGPGMALVDPGHTVHTAFNPGREEATVVIATLIGVPAEGPLMTQVDAQEGAALDEKCGIKRADAGNLLSGY
ncbi:cupin 2 conserved barrel domain protein [Thioalkalivibrio denitrificans]|uniref:Cupin 2 conserved barrel domain protein n=2 Tax=Thioalkalivibrio denitrificans TaxID=108003 RepID=A0A1V3NKE6_9GAMM|nr:cupin 2 conserved barrel domain protein [Thioalkalivibrio denitrificans]